MNRLYIITADKNKGEAHANMTLHLSTGQYKVITSLDDIKDIIFTGGIALQLDPCPMDIRAIMDLLKLNEWKILLGTDMVMRSIDSIVGVICQVNASYPDLTTPRSTFLGCCRLEERLRSMGLHKSRGYDFDVVRNPNATFGLVPKTPFMEVIVNLIKGSILNQS